MCAIPKFLRDSMRCSGRCPQRQKTKSCVAHLKLAAHHWPLKFPQQRLKSWILAYRIQGGIVLQPLALSESVLQRFL
jgi:hypothetical protein